MKCVECKDTATFIYRGMSLCDWCFAEMKSEDE